MKTILPLIIGFSSAMAWGEDSPTIERTPLTSAAKPPVTIVGENTPNSSLPPPNRVDDLDLEETMKTIGRAFRQIKTAKSTKEMAEPANIMARYASQAQTIGLIGAPRQLQQKYIDKIEQLRQEISQLQKLIALDDFSKAQKQIKILDQIRRDGHRGFKNY